MADSEQIKTPEQLAEEYKKQLETLQKSFNDMFSSNLLKNII